MAFPVGWSKQKIKIDISGLSLGADVSNYPYLLTEDAFLPKVFSNSDNGGGDLRFSSDSAGSTRLSCEIVTWNTSTSKAEIYVKIPTVAHDASFYIYVWYDETGETQPARDAAYGSDSVWTNYDFVGHLGGNYNDSSANAYNLAAGTVPTLTSSGKIGSAYDFEESSSEYVTNTDVTNLRITGDKFIQAWVKPETIGSTIRSFGCYDTTASQGWFLEQRSSNTFRFYQTGLSDLAERGTAVAGNWFHVVGGLDGVTSKIFINGVKTETTSSGTETMDAGADFSIGRAGDLDAGYYDGIIDEVRVYDGVLSDDWIKLDYNTQNSPASYVTAGNRGAFLLNFI